MLCVCDDFILFLSKTSIMSRYVTPAEFLFVFGGSSHMSTRFVVQGGHLPIQASEMVDSSSLIATGSKAGIQSLRNRLNDDGYALLRGFLPRATVLSARAFLLHSLVADGFIAPINTELDVSSSARQSTKRRKVTSVDWTAGITATALNENASPGYLSRRDLHCAEPIMKVLEHDRLFALFDRFFDEPCQTTQFKWVRAMPPNLFTGVHIDRVYMGRGSQRMLTAWIPLGDLKPDDGVMLVAAGAHRDAQLKQLYSTYGQSRAGSDGTNSGWCFESAASLPDSLDWRSSTEFRAGDVVILSLDCLHMTTKNSNRAYRLSADTRWLPEADPLDPGLVLK